MISFRHQLVGLMEKEDFNYFHTSMRNENIKNYIEEKDWYYFWWKPTKY
jgi:hypothetical protein